MEKQSKNTDQKESAKTGNLESKEGPKEDPKAKNETQTNYIELMKKGDYMVHVNVFLNNRFLSKK
jgi:hypothetical protein